MAIPTYSAGPLSTTFLGVRGLQIVIMIILLGLTGNFVNAMVMADMEPSKEIVGTLVICSLATLYTLLSISFYWAVANMGLYVMAGLDGLLMIAWIVVSFSVGKPVAGMNCYKPKFAPEGGMTSAQVLPELVNSVQKGSLFVWSGMSKGNCFATKAIWGFGIALAILYATSAGLLPALRYKHMRNGGYGKSAV